MSESVENASVKNAATAPSAAPRMPSHYREETPNRDGFMVAWPPQRYWKPAGESPAVVERPLHLYFHIPFCLQRCRYCFFKIEVLSETSHDLRERYVDALCREIDLAADAHGLRGRKVETIYFGGGTPSVLQPAQLARIRRRIEETFRIDAPEFVFEIEPVTLNDRLVDSLLDVGVNRISFGIQSFDDRVVRLTGRHDTEAKNAQAVERALQMGAVVNIDLLSGLEGETMASWQHSVDRAIGLGVHAITVYKMELYSNSRYMGDVREGRLALPDADQEMVFARWGLSRLRNRGYLPSTYFTFTRDGAFGQRHVLGRWRGEDMYGFGASAFGAVNGLALQNASEIHDYLQRVETGQCATLRSTALTSADHMLRDVVMGMKTTAVDLAAYRQRHGVDLAHMLGEDIAHLVGEGLLDARDDVLRLTDEGVLFGDYCGRYLGAGLRRALSGDARPIRA